MAAKVYDIETALPVTAQDKLKAAGEVTAEINKEHGAGSLISLGDKVGIKHPSLPSGIFELDHYVLGCGGFPRGRISEVYGPESSGKTTIMLNVLANVQKAGGLAAYVDVEHALDPSWMAVNGVDVNKLMVAQPDFGEQALSITHSLVSSGAFDLVVVDSVAALTPKAELDGEFGESHMGLQARMMSQAMRKLNSVVAKSNTALVFINQIRMKIGVMYGNPETVSGGNALKFYCSVRLDVRKRAVEKKGEEPIGNKVGFSCKKNKVGTPFRETEAVLMYDTGFNTTQSLLDAAVRYGVIVKAGSWYSLDGERLGQGAAGAASALEAQGKIDEVLAKTIAAKDAA